MRVSCENGVALVDVRDDGVGGAEVEAGTGLRGLADRLSALDGRLEIESPAGAGTIIRAFIPVPPGEDIAAAAGLVSAG